MTVMDAANQPLRASPRQGLRFANCLGPRPRTPAAIVLIAVLTVPALLAGLTTLHAQSKAAREYEIKAAFLYNFAKFVEWPPGTFSDPKQPLSICVLGLDPFGHVLDDALLGKAIGDRHVLLGHAWQISDLAGCQIVFLSAAEGVRLKGILTRMQGQHVLLVGESEGFASAGGTIQFVLDQSRVRFVINPDAADRAGLKINSKLLALATIVHDSDRSSEARY